MCFIKVGDIEPRRPFFLNEREQIKRYEEYKDHLESNFFKKNDFQTFKIVSSEFLDKFGLGDGDIFQFLLEEIESVVLNTDYMQIQISKDKIDMNIDFFKSHQIIEKIIQVCVLDKEPLLNKYVKYRPSYHNPFRIDNTAPLNKLPYKEWNISKKDALIVVYEMIESFGDTKDNTLEEFLSKFNLI